MPSKVLLFIFYYDYLHATITLNGLYHRILLNAHPQIDQGSEPLGDSYTYMEFSESWR